MKNLYIKIVSLIALMTVASACEDPLSRGPLDTITEEALWVDEVLVDVRLANLYGRSEFYRGGNNLGSSNDSDIGRLVVDAAAGGYCRTFGAWPTGYVFIEQNFTTESGTGASGVNEFWKYDLVRDINDAIEQLSADGNPLDEGFKETRLGELHFLRAWTYFQMVKRYGGVPIIKNTQQIGGDIEELAVARNSEEEVYDFIAEDLDESKSLLDDKAVIRGRVSKWAVVSLKSRAMMYAGSVGEFGESQLSGLLGISNPDKYWQLSYDASKDIIDNGGFSLYGTGSANFEEAEKNYYDLFTHALESGHNEEIFVDVYEGNGLKANDWERWCAPERDGGTTFFNTFLESYEMYEYTDGTSGTIDRSTLVEGVDHAMSDIIGNKDPRARANTFLPETHYLGATVWLHAGIVENGAIRTSGDPVVVDGVEVPAKGFNRDVIRTGMFNKKRSNDAIDVGNARGIGWNDYMIFRLGEIYLNLAEAAYALGRDAEALDALNMIRNRVNMPDKTAIDWPTIQNERAVELAFENHRYWDLRRWRIAEEKLHDPNKEKFSGVRWYKSVDNPGSYWVVHQTSGDAIDARTRKFEPHHYYFPIGNTRIQRSFEKIVENPGYGLN